MERQLRCSRVAAVILSVVLIATCFLPFINATEEYAAYLDSSGDQKVHEDADLLVAEMKHMSMYDYAKFYAQAGESIGHSKAYGVIYAVLFGSIGGFGVLSLLWSMFRKPILLLINSLLSGGAFHIIVWDLMDRGIMPDPDRVWGIAHAMVYPCVILLALCAVWMLIAKRRAE